MVATEKESQTAQEIYGQMNEFEAAEWLVNDGAFPVDEQLWGWVQRAFTQITLLIAGQPIVYAEAVKGDETGGARLVVFTDAAVVVTDVDDAESDSASPTTQIVARSQIRSLAIEGGDKFVWKPNEISTRNATFRWPGKIRVLVAYKGLAYTVELSGTGVNPHDRAQPTRIAGLIAELSADLTGSPAVVDGGSV